MYQVKTITEEDSGTDPITIEGFYDYSAQGPAGTTVTLQRSYNNGVSYEDIEDNETPFSLTGFQAHQPYRDNYIAKPTVKVRLKVKTGNFGSGSVVLRIGVQ
jgi:hypothetical protein